MVSDLCALSHRMSAIECYILRQCTYIGYPAMSKSPKQLSNCQKRAGPCCSNSCYGVLCDVYAYTVTVAEHETGTTKAMSWLVTIFNQTIQSMQFDSPWNKVAGLNWLNEPEPHLLAKWCGHASVFHKLVHCIASHITGWATFFWKGLIYILYSFFVTQKLSYV
jgi:hypothetical protein